MKKRDYNKLHKKLIDAILDANSKWHYKYSTDISKAYHFGRISAMLKLLEYNEWCGWEDKKARDLFEYDKKQEEFKYLLKDSLNKQYGKYKKLSESDIERLTDYFCKMYTNYNEKCGAAKMLQELGYITDIQYLILTDNFGQQSFDKIPVAKSTFKSILQR